MHPVFESANRRNHRRDRAAVGARTWGAAIAAACVLLTLAAAPVAGAANPCANATVAGQCAAFDATTLPPYVRDAIFAKQGSPAAGEVLVVTSGIPDDQDAEISNDMGASGCGTNPDGWQTYDCVQLSQYVPAEDSVVLALSSEWFEWYQTIFTDWMTISGAGVATVDVSINSWINSKVDTIPYGPAETGVVILTSLAADKMVDIRVADSGDHIYDTAVVVVPATWFAGLGSVDGDPTILCGNGELEPGEDCDDGNHDTDDGCSSLCLGVQPTPAATPVPSTCGNLNYTWPNGTTLPYTCGEDTCQGFRCVIGDTISPACYAADQCADACAGDCVDIQVAQLDCATMCGVQPPANDPAPPPPAPTCANLVYLWPDGTTMPYACDDSCEGQRCITGTTVSPECFAPGDCDANTCPDGTCVDTPASDCNAVCEFGEVSGTCLPEEKDAFRTAPNQQGACLGNVEQCSGSGVWEIAGGYWEPTEESCNGIDDDCNGVADDMFVTCGDPGLCQTTINTCNPDDLSVPVVCQPLAPPSPVEICGDGLDNDCEGSVDDGCECGDDECMPGETYASCPVDCLAPADGTPCDDGDFCTEGDSWQGGVCVAGAPVICDQGNACIVATACDPASGCVGTKVDCADTIECTVDSCDAVGGCVNTPDDSLCDDADPCTSDSCDAVAGCAHTPDPTCGGQDGDGDGYAAVSVGGADCDDTDPTVHPGAAELCNGIDDDCDGVQDDAFSVGGACESAANDCGEVAAGTQICSADGLAVECDATVPANPAGFGEVCTSAPNVCGATADGSVQCDGSCDAAVPVAADGDGDAAADCVDGCAADAAKTDPGVCGCGVVDVDSNANGIVDCQETTFADIAAGVERRGAEPRAGRRLRYRLEAANLGPNDVPAATLTVSISGAPVTGLRVPRACVATADTMTCSIRAIRAGHHRRLSISFVPAAGATVTVSATATSAVLDPDPTNQTAAVTTIVP
jgi:hypothetical protein